jgi:hypothetical protein
VGAGNAVTSRYLAVFADQAAEPVAPEYPDVSASSGGCTRRVVCPSPILLRWNRYYRVRWAVSVVTVEASPAPE